MNTKIEKLTAKLNDIQNRSNKEIGDIKNSLNYQYGKEFEKDQDLQKDINLAHESKEFGSDENGIYQWSRFYTDNWKEYQEYLETYLAEHGIIIDFKHDALMVYQGESLVIQDDTRNDNGVWFNNECIIDESEYKENGEIDTVKRNELIENWMEKSGYFPGVFKVDSHGNVFHVSTQRVNNK